MIPKSLQFDAIEDRIEDDEEQLYDGTSFLYDFKKRDFIYKNGNPVVVTGKKALQVWIEKAIRTMEGTYDIYENIDNDGFSKNRGYGSNVWRLIKGRKLPYLVIQAETKRDIEEALSQNHKIKRIENYSIQQGVGGESQKLSISFDVITVDGEEDFPMEVIF